MSALPHPLAEVAELRLVAAREPRQDDVLDRHVVAALRSGNTCRIGSMLDLAVLRLGRYPAGAENRIARLLNMGLQALGMRGKHPVGQQQRMLKELNQVGVGDAFSAVQDDQGAFEHDLKCRQPGDGVGIRVRQPLFGHRLLHIIAKALRLA